MGVGSLSNGYRAPEIIVANVEGVALDVINFQIVQLLELRHMVWMRKV